MSSISALRSNPEEEVKEHHLKTIVGKVLHMESQNQAMKKEILQHRQRDLDHATAKESHRARNLYIRTLLDEEQNYYLNLFDAGKFRPTAQANKRRFNNKKSNNSQN